MILARIANAIRTQNWFAVALEFVIVISGVVIGFQVTAWNEVRSERVLEYRYLERLHDAVTADQIEFDDAANLASERAAQVRAIIRAIEGPDNVTAEPADFIRSVITAAYTYTPPVDRVAFDELTTRGDIAILRNEDLRAAIAAYYLSLDSYSQWNYLRAHVQTQYMSLRNGVLTASQERLWTDENVAAGLTSADAAAVIARIAERPELVGWLAQVEAWQQLNETTFASAAERADALATVLGAELETME